MNFTQNARLLLGIIREVPEPKQRAHASNNNMAKDEGGSYTSISSMRFSPIIIVAAPFTPYNTHLLRPRADTYYFAAAQTDTHTARGTNARTPNNAFCSPMRPGKTIAQRQTVKKNVDAIEFKTQKEGRGRQSRFYYLNFSAELERQKQAIATQKMFRK